MLGLELVRRGEVPVRNQQDVARGLSVDVPEGSHCVVLVDQTSGDQTRHDLAKRQSFETAIGDPLVSGSIDCKLGPAVPPSERRGSPGRRDGRDADRAEHRRAGRAGRPGAGVGPWLEITQERVNAFADATGDHQWIHVDLERAANSPFGGTIAHGFLTLSLLHARCARISVGSRSNWASGWASTTD